MNRINSKACRQTNITTAEEAIKAIKENDYVVFSGMTAIPEVIPQALMAHKEAYHNVHFFHMLAFGNGACLRPEAEGHFHHITNFAGVNSRKALEEQRADFIPCYFKDVPSMLGSAFPVDVAVVQVSPPDHEGFCSFSAAIDYAKAAAEKAAIVIAEANDQAPCTGGPENKLHLSQIDYLVPCSYPLPEIPRPTITDTEKAIGRHCASLVEDGDTLQLGIGAIPDAVLLSLKEKKDLGIHTEMFSDGVIELIESGVINGRKKTLHPGKLISALLMGTQKLYDFVDRHPDVELYPVDYTNDPWVIAQNDHMISINSCLEVDLMGQVTSETIGLRQFSGSGGQVDYIRGAALSKGGKSILTMPSTAAKGALSRIVPFLTQGAAVTTGRNDVDYIVTEYGIAKLKGKTLRQRAEELIRIAHPDFRETLQAEYHRRFIRR